MVQLKVLRLKQIALAATTQQERLSGEQFNLSLHLDSVHTINLLLCFIGIVTTLATLCNGFCCVFKCI
jgi:hypothetical protein